MSVIGRISSVIGRLIGGGCTPSTPTTPTPPPPAPSPGSGAVKLNVPRELGGFAAGITSSYGLSSGTTKFEVEADYPFTMNIKCYNNGLVSFAYTILDRITGEVRQPEKKTIQRLAYMQFFRDNAPFNLKTVKYIFTVRNAGPYAQVDVWWQ